MTRSLLDLFLDYSFPAASQKALQKGNGTQVKDNWEAATVHPPAEFVEPDLHTPFSSTLEEEEGLLPIDHLRGGVESLQTSGPEVTSSEPAGQEESLLSVVFSTASARPGVVTEAAMGGQEEDSAPPGLDLGSSMGPSLLPMSSVSSTAAARSPGISEEPFEVTDGDTWAVGGAYSEQTVTTARAELAEPTVEAGGEEHSAREEFLETTVGWEMLEPTVLTELEQPAETPVWTPSPGGSSIDTQTHSGGEQHPASPATPWDRAEEPMQDPVWNDTEPATEAVTAEGSLSPQAGDARMALLPTELPWDSAQVELGGGRGWEVALEIFGRVFNPLPLPAP